MADVTTTADQHPTPAMGSVLAQREGGLAGAFLMLRRASRLTAKDVAQILDLPVDTVHAIERGHHPVDTELAEKYLDAVDASDRMRRRVRNLLEFDSTPLMRGEGEREVEMTAGLPIVPLDGSLRHVTPLVRAFEDVVRRVDDGADSTAAVEAAVTEYAKSRPKAKPRVGALPDMVMVKPGWRRVVNAAQGDPRQWPDPRRITTEAQLTTALSAIRASTGMAYGKLAELTVKQRVYKISKSSMHSMCTKPTVSYQVLALESFLQACGADDRDAVLGPWREAWQRVRQNAAMTPKPSTGVPAPAAAELPAAEPAEAPSQPTDCEATVKTDTVDLGAPGELDEFFAPQPVEFVTSQQAAAASGQTEATVRTDSVDLGPLLDEFFGPQPSKAEKPAVTTAGSTESDPMTANGQTMSSLRSRSAPHSRRAKSPWAKLVEANADEPMKLAGAAAMVIGAAAAAIVFVALALHVINTLS